MCCVAAVELLDQPVSCRLAPLSSLQPRSWRRGAQRPHGPARSLPEPTTRVEARHLLGSVRRRFADDPHASVAAAPTTPLPGRRSASAPHWLRPSPLRGRPPRVCRRFADDPAAGQEECSGESWAPSITASTTAPTRRSPLRRRRRPRRWAGVLRRIIGSVRRCFTSDAVKFSNLYCYFQLILRLIGQYQLLT